ncbi:MAG: hypothetical protein V4747_04335 [Pseudomonadota bacterium]
MTIRNCFATRANSGARANAVSIRDTNAYFMVRGVDAATLTSILLLAYPERYGVWNGTSEPEMRERGVWPTFTHGASEGEKYEIVNTVLLQLARDLNVDLWTLDALWWMSKLERKNTGHYFDSRDIAIWNMAEQASQTAKQSSSIPCPVYRLKRTRRTAGITGLRTRCFMYLST